MLYRCFNKILWIFQVSLAAYILSTNFKTLFIKVFQLLKCLFFSVNTFAFNFAPLQMNERKSELSVLFQAVCSLYLGAVFSGRVQQGMEASSNITLSSFCSLPSMTSSHSTLQCSALLFVLTAAGMYFLPHEGIGLHQPNPPFAAIFQFFF